MGGPLDGRVLPVLTGPTGHPPKVYEVPVPVPGGGAPVVHVYLREIRGRSKRLALPQGWKYVYASEGRPATRLGWPWSKDGSKGRP